MSPGYNQRYVLNVFYRRHFESMIFSDCLGGFRKFHP